MKRLLLLLISTLALAWAAHVYVGLAAIKTSDKRLAIESIQKAVRLNPVNQFAIDRLKELHRKQ